MIIVKIQETSSEGRNGCGNPIKRKGYTPLPIKIVIRLFSVSIVTKGSGSHSFFGPYYGNRKVNRTFIVVLVVLDLLQSSVLSSYEITVGLSYSLTSGLP